MADGHCTETQPQLRRRLQREASHGMAPSDDFNPDYGFNPDHVGEDGELLSAISQKDLDALQALMEEKFGAMSSEQRADELQKIQTTKQIILDTSESGQDLLMKADNLIDEDWLGKINEMPGNIYRIAAFGGLQIFPNDDAPVLQNLARAFGAFLVFLIQLLAPPCLFLTSSWGFGIGESKQYAWDKWCARNKEEGCFENLSDWSGEEGFWLAKSMGIVFICLFSLNGLFVIIDERRCWNQIDNMLRYLDENTPAFQWSGEWLLYLDAFMSCWVVTWCTLDAYILVGASQTMKDVLFDSLSLLFLYNLDDISGDLGFVNQDDWDGLRLGWIYEEMVKCNYNPRAPPDPDYHVDEEEPDNAACFCLSLYTLTGAALAIASFALPILAIFTPFGQIAPED